MNSSTDTTVERSCTYYLLAVRPLRLSPLILGSSKENLPARPHPRNETRGLEGGSDRRTVDKLHPRKEEFQVAFAEVMAIIAAERE